MVKLNNETLGYIAEDLNTAYKKELRKQDYTRFLMFNGKTLDVVKEYIQKEFEDPATVEELNARLIPLNIVHKIISKLAGVYNEAPLREISDGNEADQDLLDTYVNVMMLDSKMKEANRYFKLYKRNLMELLVDDDGIPVVRNLPRHTYEVYSFNSKTPERPNVIAKILVDSQLEDEQVIAVWTDKEHKIINGKGQILNERMALMGNVEGINPYGKMPFIYINEATYSVDPLGDDDLVRVAIAVDVLLSDLAFSIKYQTFSLIYTIGDVGNVPSNPSSVIALDYSPEGNKPEIGTVKPEVDIMAIINYVTNILSTLLSSKSLKASTIKTTQSSSVGETASGISKMLDHAESVEDKKDQQAYFHSAEYQLWNLISKYLIPVWRKAGELNEAVNREFSSSLDVFVAFRDPMPMLSEKERIEISGMRVDNNLSTYRMELKQYYPHMRDEQIEELYLEIMKEKQERAAFQMALIGEEEEENGKEMES